MPLLYESPELKLIDSAKLLNRLEKRLSALHHNIPKIKNPKLLMCMLARRDELFTVLNILEPGRAARIREKS